MLHEIKPASLHGKMKMPASKSFVQRFIAAASLANGMSVIHNPGRSEDVLASMAVAEKLGMYARTLSNGDIMLQPDKPFAGGVLFCRESGLCARMFAPIAATFGRDFSIDGERSLKRRHLLHELRQLEQFGMSVNAVNGDIPISLSGKLKSAAAVIDASRSSQLLTGLLMALPVCDQDSSVIADSLVSKPYVDMTVDMLKRCGVEVANEGPEYFIRGNQTYKPIETDAETDWSAASNIMVAAALCGELEISGLNNDSFQADKTIVSVFERSNVDYTWLDDSSMIVRQSNPKAFSLDLTDAPDLFPAVVPLALRADGPCRFTHVNRLVNKESNRLKAVIREYTKMGARFEEQGDDSVIVYPGKLHFSNVNSWGDHRIVMSLSIAGMANQGVSIHDSGHVAKSWPDFFNQIQKAGGKISAHLR
jgi:3-phosphoshikimate 1-carboxyvinyltransferase